MIKRYMAIEFAQFKASKSFQTRILKNFHLKNINQTNYEKN